MAKPLPSSTRSSARRLAEGRLGRQVVGAETVEIKATIEAKNLKAALKLLGLKEDAAEQRIIYFFDTRKLELFRSGVIVRARRVPGGSHDSTVKIRPIGAGDVAAKWRDNKGFKLEADAGEKGVVLSGSLSRSVDKGVIKSTVAGDTDVSAVFDKDQELFLAEMCRIRYQLATLKVLGPIAAQWWKVQHPGLPYPMTAEVWDRGDRQKMLEVSIRVATAQAAFAKAGFMAFLAELGAAHDNALQTKTLWALKYCADTLAADAAPVKLKSTKDKVSKDKPAKSKGAKPAARNKPEKTAKKAKSGAKSAPKQAPSPAAKTVVKTASRAKSKPAGSETVAAINAPPVAV
jgi:hypothetical protein